MSAQIGDISDDGFWMLTEDGWQPTAQQEQALAEGATPHDSTPVSMITDTNQGMEPQMVTIGGGFSTSPNDNSVLYWRIAAGVIVFVGIIIVIALMLGQSEEEKNLMGTWENEVDSLEFKESGKLSHAGGIYDGWSVDGDIIYFTDSSDPDYEWWHKYEIKGKMLFAAGLDESGNPVRDECVAMVKKGYNFDDELEKVSIPSWCNPYL